MGAVSFKDVTLRYAGTGRRRRRRAARGGAKVAIAATESAGAQSASAAERPALAGLNLEIADGEFLVLVGPSGSGKSTALRILAGLEQPTSGAVLIDGDDITGVDPAERDVAMVFQTYALYPHKTVEQNMSFALQLAKVPREEISRRVRRAAEQLGLTELLDRRPRQLSGGQRQRVAMGRAIVREPTVFLMDEPLSNLDARLRVQTRAQIAELQNRLGTTTVYVTHDQSEAMTLGDRVAVLDEGVLHQVAPPRELYDRPADIFVAGFIGSPAMNLLTIADDEFDRLAPGATSGGARADDVVFGVRPEHLAITPADAGLLLHIDHVEEFGAEAYAHGRLVDSAHTERVITRLRTDARPALGDTVRVVADPERVHTFDRATGQRVEANVALSASAV